jgi:signal transduction histidine kinase
MAAEEGEGGGPWGLFSRRMLLFAWLPIVVIGVCHYATGTHHHWAHDILRRLYYVPILFAAFARGLPGGVATALVASLTYAPHAFLLMPYNLDPATTLNKVMEIILYNAIGVVAGVLAQREAERRREVEAAYAEEQRMAAQLVRAGRLAALGELVAGIAHEIKNPLHTIKGTAEIVDDIVPRDRPEAKMWQLLRQEIERLEKIAERFLSFARPLRPDLRVQPWAGVYARMGELVRAQAHGARGVAVVLEEPPSHLARLEVRVDRDQLAQVVLSITSNALRALSTGGRITIRTTLRPAGDAAPAPRTVADAALLAAEHGAPGVPPGSSTKRTRGATGRADHWLALSIENDGPPIAAGDLERIFDPFYTRSEQGTGLGLAIAERIAEAHGGYLEVANLPSGTGVRFALLLPLRA